jgi:hypothetical protein
MNFRKIDFKQEQVKAVKNVKRESDKYSDFCRNLEFLGIEAPVWYDMDSINDNYWEERRPFQGQRVVA